jgi:hypothetical protein
MAKNGSSRAKSPTTSNGHHAGEAEAGAPKNGSVYTFPGVSNHEIRRVAVQAMCDPRCVVKYLRGMRQPQTVRARVAAALEACGMAKLVGTPDERLERARNIASLSGDSRPPPSR